MVWPSPMLIGSVGVGVVDIALANEAMAGHFLHRCKDAGSLMPRARICVSTILAGERSAAVAFGLCAWAASFRGPGGAGEAAEEKQGATPEHPSGHGVRVVTTCTP